MCRVLCQSLQLWQPLRLTLFTALGPSLLPRCSALIPSRSPQSAHFRSLREDRGREGEGEGEDACIVSLASFLFVSLSLSLSRFSSLLSLSLSHIRSVLSVFAVSQWDTFAQWDCCICFPRELDRSNGKTRLGCLILRPVLF